MDYEEPQLRLPAPVKHTLHNTLCLLLNKNTPYLKINEVYVYGKDLFHELKTDSTDDDNDVQWLDSTTRYSQNTVHVLCQYINPTDSYGPFTTMQIFNISRAPRIPIYRIMDIIDNGYSELGDLENVSNWKLQDEDIYPKKIFELPETIRHSIKFAVENCQPELVQCQGILLVPAVVQHRGWQHKRVQLIQRDNMDITLVEVDTGVWFLLQSCPARFYEDECNPVWFMVHTIHLDKMLL